jgi:hypothetical protein
VPWIDVHLHLVGGRGARTDYPGAADVAVTTLDRFGAAMGIVLPPPQADGQPGVYDASTLAGAVTRHPGRLAYLGGGGTLNALIHRHPDPARVSDAARRELAVLAEQILDAGAIGFGELAAFHISAAPGHPYMFVPADHPLFLALADVAAQRDVPIDLHMDATDSEMRTPPRFAIEIANPPRLPETLSGLGRLLTHNRRARIVWAHGASDPLGAMSATTLGRLMDAHPNLFVSLRLVGPEAPVMTNKALAPSGELDPDWKALLTRHPDRFTIGTDSFMVSPAVRGSGPGLTFARRNEARLQATARFLSLLPGDLARQVGRENAIRIYRLP